METLFSYLEKVTGVNNLENRSWQDVVDNVILPMMAYPANRRNRIGNAFMKFMAEFTQDVCRKDEHLGNIMLEIAMQRISDGAVLHPDDPTPTFEALPQAYRTYVAKRIPGRRTRADGQRMRRLHRQCSACLP